MPHVSSFDEEYREMKRAVEDMEGLGRRGPDAVEARL